MLLRECLCMCLHSELERVCWHHFSRGWTMCFGLAKLPTLATSTPHKFLFWWKYRNSDFSVGMRDENNKGQDGSGEVNLSKFFEDKTIFKIACSDSCFVLQNWHLRTRTSKNVLIWKLFSKTERDETPMGTWGLFGTCFTTSPNSSCWTVFLTGITLHFAVLCFCFREPRRHPAEWRFLDLPDPGTSTTYKWLDEKAAWPLCHRSIKFIQDARNVNQLQKNRISRQSVIYLQRPQQLIWIFSPKQGHGQNSRLRLTTCISLKKTKRILRQRPHQT